MNRRNTFGRRLAVGFVCGATLTMYGCGDGVNSLTAPSASASSPSARVTEETRGGTAATRSHVAQLPFHGSIEATETETGSFPVLSVTLTGEGNATHLGKYSAIFTFHLDLRTISGVGSFTLTAANGDTLFGDLAGHGTVGNGLVMISETGTITGGTGRFAEASGSFVVTRTLVQATGVSSGSFDGTIDLHE
jgi:hypothetical protein